MTTATETSTARAHTGLFGLLTRYFRLGDTVEGWLGPVFLLGMRLWMGYVFFQSGFKRVTNDFSSEVFVFAEEFKLPLLPPELWTVITIAGELTIPVLLVLGLFGRFAGLGILIMTMTIQFLIGLNNDTYYLDVHWYWMFLSLTVVCFGPGKLSIDHLLEKRLGR